MLSEAVPLSVIGDVAVACVGFDVGDVIVSVGAIKSAGVKVTVRMSVPG